MSFNIGGIRGFELTDNNGIFGAIVGLGYLCGYLILFGIPYLLYKVTVGVYNFYVDEHNKKVRQNNAELPDERIHSVKSTWTELDGRKNVERTSERFIKPQWAR